MSQDASSYINWIYKRPPDGLMYREFSLERIIEEETDKRLSTDDDFFYVKLALINEYQS